MSAPGRRTLRRAAVGALVIAAVAAGAAWFARGPLSVEVAARIARVRLAQDPFAALPDGLHVGLCGAGSPFPDEHRAGPCTLVIAGRRTLVIDAGAGAVANLARMGVDHGRIDAILLTHFHSDHIDGLGGLLLQRWVAGGHARPVPVHGPPGVETVVDGLARAYSADKAHRVEHHGEATVPPGGFGGDARPFSTDAGARAVVVSEPDLEIVAFEVDHAPARPAVGYRIRYKDRVVVLSGDTRRSDAVAREARGADLLVHEALSAPILARLRDAAAGAGRRNLEKLLADIVDYHASPEDAADTAAAAGVRMLLMNHIVPPLPLPGMERAFLGDAASRFAGPIRVGRDGDFVTLPAGSTAVEVGRRF